MNLDPTYALVLGVGLLMSVGTALAGRFFPTPYGRFGSRKLGPEVPIRLGWVLMEAPAVLSFAWFYPRGPAALEAVPLLFAGVWALHYSNRAILFPYLMQARPGSKMSASVFATGWVVTSMHGWLYATWLSRWGTHLDASWLVDPRLWIGLALYGSGLGLLLHTEALLRRLRAQAAPGEDPYKIPYGGGYRWVSSPHYLGELMAWTGLMVATWCPGGLFVLLISAANLVPRALATHKWYRDRFPDYPADRRALVPLLW